MHNLTNYCSNYMTFCRFNIRPCAVQGSNGSRFLPSSNHTVSPPIVFPSSRRKSSCDSINNSDADLQGALHPVVPCSVPTTTATSLVSAIRKSPPLPLSEVLLEADRQQKAGATIVAFDEIVLKEDDEDIYNCFKEHLYEQFKEKNKQSSRPLIAQGTLVSSTPSSSEGSTKLSEHQNSKTEDSSSVSPPSSSCSSNSSNTASAISSQHGNDRVTHHGRIRKRGDIQQRAMKLSGSVSPKYNLSSSRKPVRASSQKARDEYVLPCRRKTSPAHPCGM